jgi:uncharacterized membrane protein
MIESSDRVDRLVEDYLGAVSYACGDLPPERRDDLLADLREHIAAARAVLYEPTEAAVRTILDRLGEPSAIAEEARLTEPSSARAPAGQASPGQSEASLWTQATSRLLTRPMPPAVFAILVAFVTLVVAMLLLGTVITLFEGGS